MSYNLKTLAKIWRDGNNRGNKIGITALGKYGNYVVPVPAGLIVPYNDTSIPNGWSRFTSADNRMIVGAGSTYGVTTTGGTSTVNLSTTTGSAGAHATGTTFKTHRYSFNTGSVYQTVAQSAGAHTHTVNSFTYNPLCNEIVLIKADGQTTSFPLNSAILSTGSVDTSGLTNLINNSKYLKSNSTIQQTGNTSVSAGLAAAGGHIHSTNGGKGYNFGGGTTYDWYWQQGAGSHTPSNVTLNISESIKKVQLSAWTNASSSFSLIPNMIGMYESLTPPSGWVLCDGNNGTPDLRDCFINTVNGGSENTTPSGNNTISASSSTINHSASHNHQGSYAGNLLAEDEYHTTYAWSHTHGAISKSVAYLPPYYALAFIMKA